MTDSMGTSDKARAIGFKSLKELSEQESRTTGVLRRWDANNPEFFNRFLNEAWKRRKKQ
jgi:hypothetical protein